MISTPTGQGASPVQPQISYSSHSSVFLAPSDVLPCVYLQVCLAGVYPGPSILPLYNAGGIGREQEKKRV